MTKRVVPQGNANGSRQSLLMTGLVLSLCFLLLTGILMARLGISPTQPSGYNTYTRQALAWRQGRAHLAEDVPHLELAIYKGKYYVSFPPVPSVPIFLLTFIFGEQVPDGLLNLAYALLALLVLFRLLYRAGFGLFGAASWAFLALFASSLLPMVLSGAVWYQAQVLGLLLILLSIERMEADQPFWGLVCYALSVGCRPFHALYGPLLILLYMKKRQTEGRSFKEVARALLPGVLAGLFIAALYGAYNYIRFDSFLEFGHNHLPEFSFQGGKQFALSHVTKNIRQYIFALPFEQGADGLKLKVFGFSLFLANPVLLLLLIWAVYAIIKRRFTLGLALILSFFAFHLFVLLLHRTFGGYQFGARYAVDLIPYAILFLLRRHKKSITAPERALMLIGLAFCIYGALMIHI